MKDLRFGALTFLALIALAITPFGLANAQVTVTSADPSTAPQGTISLDVTVNGSGFDGTAAVNFFVSETTNPGGITVKKVSVKGPKRLVATIDVADTAIVSKFDIHVTLSNGRKGKGTTLFSVQAKANDSCAAAVGFPAFMYYKSNGTDGVYLADSTGLCSRFVIYGISPAWSRFAYPVRDDLGVATNRGRIVWRGRDLTAQTPASSNAFWAMDVTVNGTNINVGPAHLIRDFGDGTLETGSACCGIDISADGRDIYVTPIAEVRPEGFVHTVVRMSLPANLGELDASNPPEGLTVYEHAAAPTSDGLMTMDMSVNAGNDFLYIIEEYPHQQHRLLRVDLDADRADTGMNPEVTMVADQVFAASVAADLSSASSDLITYTIYSPAVKCSLVVVMNGRTGTVLNEGTQWLSQAGQLSWDNGKVLNQGASYNKQGCRSTGWIVAIDPVTGATAPLLSGGAPEGR